jgi:uridine kinase
MPELETAGGPTDPVDVATDLLLSRPSALGTVRLGVVDGPSGSGKSTFAQRWSDRLLRVGCVAVTMFSSDDLATWDDPFGWWDRLDRDLLRPLAAGRPGRIRVTEWVPDGPRPGHVITIAVPKVLILEGVSCGRAAVGNRASVVVWVEVIDRAARLERAVARDGEASRSYLRAWQDDEERFFGNDRTADRADVVVHPDP